MKKENRRAAYWGMGLLATFAVWTEAVCLVDVQPIGPQGSTVGLATMNGFFHKLTGVHLPWYYLTDWLSVIPIGFALGFAVLGLTQWIQQKSLLKVERSLMALGGFYAAVMIFYVLFEALAVNFRPVLLDGRLEASYPSSTTVLVLCVMITAMMQLSDRIRNQHLRRWVAAAMPTFTALMVVGRIISGVHWLSDIIGGILLSAGLILLYAAVSRTKN